MCKTNKTTRCVNLRAGVCLAGLCETERQGTCLGNCMWVCARAREPEAVTNENTYECMSTCVECPRDVSKRACPWGSCELPGMLAVPKDVFTQKSQSGRTV